MSGAGSNSLDTAELVARCVAGDDQAQAQFCTEYLGLVQRAVSRKLAQLLHVLPLRADVEDISHEVFERLLAANCRLLGRLRRPLSLNAWLVTIAQNHTVDHLRKRSARERVYASVAREGLSPEFGQRPPATPAEEVMSREQSFDLAQRMAELDPLDRLILELYFIHRLKYAEIADMIHMNINTVSARLRRAKAKLRTLVEEGNRTDKISPRPADARQVPNSSSAVSVAETPSGYGADSREPLH